jgi:hypothetical protein
MIALLLPGSQRLSRVDLELNCIKGGGACHLREKVIAEAANTYVGPSWAFILNPKAIPVSSLWPITARTLKFSAPMCVLSTLSGLLPVDTGKV